MSGIAHHGLLFGGGGAGTTYLDNLAVSPRAVWSLRKLISTATNSIRVRRSNDNAEQDIGFSGNSLDTASLGSFVGSNSAYIVKWYDQTGNGEDALQSTAANQPRIVNAGSIQSAVTFDGSNDFLQVTSLANTGTACGLYMKIKDDTPAPAQIIFETSTNYNSNAGAIIFYAEVSNHTAGMCQSSGTTRANSYGNGSSLSSMIQVTALYDRTIVGSQEIKVWFAGSQQSDSSVAAGECTGNFSSYDAYFGGRGGSSLFSHPEIETLVFYNADTSAIRTSIEALVA